MEHCTGVYIYNRPFVRVLSQPHYLQFQLQYPKVQNAIVLFNCVVGYSEDIFSINIFSTFN